jgi:hypothetical protein
MKTKDKQLFYYSFPKYWGEKIIEYMNQYKNWELLHPEWIDKELNTQKIIDEGKWNFYWKNIPYVFLNNKKYSLYNLPKPDINVLQVVNHFPNIDKLVTKVGLAKSLEKYYKDVKKIYPRTYVINEYIDSNELKNSMKIESKYWIAKPNGEFGSGLGVRYFNDPLKSIEYCINNIKNGIDIKDYRRDGENIKEIKKKEWVVQRYISNPYLYRGRKFDIRFYVLFKDNGEIYFCNYHFIKLSSLPFTLRLSFNEEKNGIIHVTNQVFQKTYKFYSKYEEGNTLLFENFKKYLKEDIGEKEGNMMYEKILKDAKHLSRKIIEGVWEDINIKETEVPNRRYYEFIAIDCILDDTFNLWLLEADANPSMNKGIDWGDKIAPKVLEETIKICVEPLFGGKIPEKLEWFEQI